MKNIKNIVFDVRFRQFIRYGIVGILSNALGYIIYLLITWLGVDPKVTITIFYPMGAIISYFGHSSYSFSYRGGHSLGLLKYVIAHISGYLLNLFSLLIFVDYLSYPHQLVQFMNIFLVAGFLFLSFKFYVFKAKSVIRENR